MEKMADVAQRLLRQAVAASRQYPDGLCIVCGVPVEPLQVGEQVVRAYICADCERMGRT